MSEDVISAAEAPSANYAEMTSEIVSAYVTKNVLVMSELPSFIFAVHATLKKAADGAVIFEKPAEGAKPPAVPIKKSITEDFIICLEDGRKFKSLRRHLNAAYGLTPEQYRSKWKLPNDYPMVAPSYAKTRSELAKSLGLGTLRKTATPVAPGKRGRAGSVTKKAA